ncbi:hypothetical protein GGR56DRAFT_509968 [Xylariaceae sp. FL0804]|nr:hypothetical protein GGR56DRAFT_509968 [Xylariaceae sp. FL0804]
MLIDPAAMASGQRVDLLVLGAGWTSTFLLPLLAREGVRHAATTTDGRAGTIAFRFDPASDDPAPFRRLPAARTVLVVFPLKGAGQAARLVRLYAEAHGNDVRAPNYIQFGVTSIWNAPDWNDESSPYDKENPRAIAEDELMGCAKASVLSLAGLYGAARQPRNWVDRVIKTKADLRAKGALHVIHGDDVARAVVALHRRFTPGRRWLLCDTHVYDWWDLVQDWAVEGLRREEEKEKEEEEEDGNDDEDMARAARARVARHSELRAWVGELMLEEGVRALPRDTAAVGRRLDGRAFWREMGIWPSRGRIR